MLLIGTRLLLPRRILHGDYKTVCLQSLQVYLTFILVCDLEGRRVSNRYQTHQPDARLMKKINDVADEVHLLQARFSTACDEISEDECRCFSICCICGMTIACLRFVPPQTGRSTSISIHIQLTDC